MAANTQSMRRSEKLPPLQGTFSASLKAGILGGFAISLLLTVYQIAPNFLQTVLIPPALFIVWVVTGLGAAMLSDDKIRNSRDSASIGMVAGVIAGVIGGIAAMIIAAFGYSFQDWGRRLFIQATPSQIDPLLAIGFTEQLLIASASIMTALFACGIGGMIVAAIFGRLGGWLYPKFSQ